MGDRLYRSGSEVVIGQDVEKVIVGASLFTEVSGNGPYVWAVITKNGTNTLARAIVQNRGSYASVAIAPYVINVSDGDKLALKFLDTPNGTVKVRGYNSWMTVFSIS